MQPDNTKMPPGNKANKENRRGGKELSALCAFGLMTSDEVKQSSQSAGNNKDQSRPATCDGFLL